MALPAENSAWPPPQDADRYDRMRVNSIWYEGDPDRLANLYKGGHIESADAGVEAGFKARVWRVVHRWFWGTNSGTAEKDTKIHVPVAQDIATLSSELLFAEPPTVRLDAPPKIQPKAPPKPSPVTGTLPPDPLTGVVPEVGTPPIDPVTGEVETEEVDDPKGVEAQETSNGSWTVWAGRPSCWPRARPRARSVRWRSALPGTRKWTRRPRS